MTAEGSIQDQALPEVLLELGREARTGILTIQGQQDIIAFAFLRGGIVSADALNQTMEDGLGPVLTDLELVSASQFAELAAEYQAGGGQVVDLLVERGFIGRAELLDAVRTHTYRLCRQALEWTEGEYKFYQGEEVSYEEGVLPLPPGELLIRAGGDLGRELLPGGAPAGGDVFRRVKGATLPAPAEGDDEGGGGEAPDAGADAAFGLVDGKRTVDEIAAESGQTESRVAYLLHSWRELGLVEREKKGRASKPAPAARRQRQRRRDPGGAAKQVPVGERPPRQPSWLVRWWRGMRQRPPSESHPWPPRALGLGLMAALIVSFAAEPARFLLPFPWQRVVQESLDREQLEAELARLRRANGVYYLLQGRFAERLSDLAASDLLPELDLRDGAGRPLSYSASETSYVVRSQAQAGANVDSYLQETIRGDFLLDPELELATESREPALILLD